MTAMPEQMEPAECRQKFSDEADSDQQSQIRQRHDRNSLAGNSEELHSTRYGNS